MILILGRIRLFGWCALFACVSSLSLRSARGQEVRLIKVTATVSQVSTGGYRVAWEVRNTGTEDEYIADSVRLANGTISPSLDLDTDKTGKNLIIGYRLFPLSSRMLLTKNESAVHLILLHPQESHEGEFDLRLPNFQTMPPYGSEFARKKIADDSVRAIVVVVGTFPADEAIRRVLTKKPSGWVNGLENTAISSAEQKPLVALQRLFSSEPMLKPE